MSINVSWDASDDYIVRWDFPETYSMDDMLHAFDETETLASEYVGVVRLDMIVTGVNTLYVPRGLIAGLLSIHKQTPTEGGPQLVVMCTNSHLHRTIMGMVSRLTGSDHWLVVSSLEEAREMICRSRQTLKPSPHLIA